MYLHLGSNQMIRKDKVIAIINMEIANNNEINRKFFKTIKNKHKIEKVYNQGKEKSFVLTDDVCYFSPISSFTLLKRSNSQDFDVEI
ncbi:MAG: DUF370 domain-containing protein [Peptococcaceae bacterium]|nr:DUF370 domain-containing protein [Peptococcaceae bacterium]